MRRLIEEYGITLLYIITGIICIVLFSAVFFGENSSVSSVINSSIDDSTNQDLSIKYTISYDLNGGHWKEGSEDTIPFSYTKEDRVYLPIPVRDNYLFAGWTGSRLTEAKINVVIPEGSTGNRSYTATWTRGYYRIVYDWNKDYMLKQYSSELTKDSNKNHTNIDSKLISSWFSGEYSSQLVDYDNSSVSIAQNGYSFAGHKFIAWNTNADGNGTKYTAGTTTTALKSQTGTVSWAVQDIKLYAQWELITYKIDYQSTLSNGSKGDWTAVRCTEEKKITQEICNDYNSDGSCKTNLATKEITVCDTGKWSSKDTDGNDLKLPSSYTIIDTIKLPTVQAEGYTSNGWYFRDPYSDENNMQTDRVSEVNKSETDAITINGNKYEGTGLNSINFTYNNTTLTNDNGYINDYIIPGTTGNLVIYPHWKGEEYVVTFDKNLENLNINNVDLNSTQNGNKVNVSDILSTISTQIQNFPDKKVVTYGDAYGYLKEPYISKDTNKPEKTYKYKFMGWSLDPTCTLTNDKQTGEVSSKSLYEEVTYSTIVKTSKDHTLYACWDPITYKIRLHSNY